MAPPRSQRVRSLDELFAAGEAIGFPSVVKPEFGASAVGCVRIDSLESLPGVYKIVRSELATTDVVDLRAGNDLLLEEYLDGVEVRRRPGAPRRRVCVLEHFPELADRGALVSGDGPSLPPDHRAKPVRRLVQLCVETVQAFGFRCGVLHVEGKCTSRGPRIVEVNARMGGGRIHHIVEAVRRPGVSKFIVKWMVSTLTSPSGDGHEVPGRVRAGSANSLVQRQGTDNGSTRR